MRPWSNARRVLWSLSLVKGSQRTVQFRRPPSGMLGSESAQKINRRSERNGAQARTGTRLIHIDSLVRNRGVRSAMFD